MAREINLVPDIKDEMIKTLKLRNFIFFLCIIVASVSIAVTAIAAAIMGGQQAALQGKKETIDNLSRKINSYSDLSDFLTIKDQLGNISSLTENKKMLSRTFDILSAIIPTGADTIKISELSINLAEEKPTFTFEAQANAGKDPFIDYRVLDSFKKSMKYLHYDYGNYVDKEGNIIPSYCMIEYGQDGGILNDATRGIYAFWTIDAKGCNPSAKSTDSNSTTTNATNYETYNDQRVVRIWRTPQYDDWYKSNPSNNQPSMSLDGTISNVEHFNSACTTYTGVTTSQNGTPKWTETNDNCLLVPDGDNGIVINDSSNGRGAEDQLVLRFSAVISLNSAVYAFNNHHMLALAASGHHNVTDSYVQIQAMFSKRAVDCAAGDTECDNVINEKGEE